MTPLEAAERAVPVRRRLHSLAEKSLQEKETAAYLRNLFEEAGLATEDRGGWFYALRRCDGQPKRKPVAFVADLDALPIPETLALPYASRREGVSHKCGHDGHMAALYGLALVLRDREADRDIYFILEPGEEIGAGGEGCSALLEEKDIGEVYAFHNRPGMAENEVACKAGCIQCASCGLTVRFHGKTSHASEPEQGNNPAAAVAELVLRSVAYAAAPHDGLVLLTPVHMLVGSRDFGVNPGEGEVSMTLRAEKDAELEALEAFVTETASRLAEENRLKCGWEKHDVFPETANDPRCAGKVQRCAGKAGLAFLALEAPWRASEDFGWYTRHRPGAMFFIGAGEDWPALHTRAYDFNEALLCAAISMFLSLALDA